MFNLSFPSPKTTRKQLETLIREVADAPRLLSQDELSAMLVYLAPPKPKKVCVDGLALAAKLSSGPLSVINVKGGYAFNSHSKLVLRAKTYEDDGWYDIKTLLKSRYAAPFEKPAVLGKVRCLSPLELPNLKSRLTKSGGYYLIGDDLKFSKLLLDGVVNGDDATTLYLADIGEKGFVIYGENDMSNFILRGGA